MNYHEAVKKLFDTFYNKIYKTNYRLDLDQGKQRKMVDNLVKLLASQIGLHSIGLNTLTDLFSFSFAYYSNLKTKRNITLNWIIGKKTVTRWLERKEGTDYYTDQFIKEYEIDLDLLKQQLYELDNKQEGGIELDPLEESEKKRFQSNARLYHCVQYTTLYNHRSMICLQCINRVTCKKLLSTTYPRLYFRRGYLIDESI